MDLHQFADAIDRELERLNQEREHWLGAKAHVEDLIRLRAEPASVLATPLQSETQSHESTAPVRRRRSRRSENGQISMRQAVLEVLQRAGGGPIRVEEVLAQAQALGATTVSKTPKSTVESQLYLLKSRDKMPVEKVDRETWRWAGPVSDNELHGGDASRQEELIKQEARP